MYWLLGCQSGVFIDIDMKRNHTIQVHWDIYELKSGIRLLYTLKYNKMIVQTSLLLALGPFDHQLMGALYSELQ